MNHPVYETAKNYQPRYEGDRYYMSAAETAKLVRSALKKAFPGVKFSVRSSNYSMGSSIHVGFPTNAGVTRQEVNEVCDRYSGARFDGMIDLKYHAEHWLNPDGSAVVKRTYGHSYDHSNQPTFAPHHPEAVTVHMGADYVSAQENTSLNGPQPKTTPEQDEMANELFEMVQEQEGARNVTKQLKGKTYVINWVEERPHATDGTRDVAYRFRVTSWCVYKDIASSTAPNASWRKATMRRSYCGVSERGLQGVKNLRAKRKEKVSA